MDTRPIVYALVIGWIVGSDPLPAPFSSWVETRNRSESTAVAADCTLGDTSFQLRQVLLDLKNPSP